MWPKNVSIDYRLVQQLYLRVYMRRRVYPSLARDERKSLPTWNRRDAHVRFYRYFYRTARVITSTYEYSYIPVITSIIVSNSFCFFKFDSSDRRMSIRKCFRNDRHVYQAGRVHRCRAEGTTYTLLALFSLLLTAIGRISSLFQILEERKEPAIQLLAKNVFPP